MTDNDNSPQVTPAQVLELLRTRFPGAFPAASEAARPLKIGIREDLLRILGETMPRPALLKGLSAYISSPVYQAAVAQGGERVDLAGNPSGPVAEKDQAYAAQRVVILQQRQRAKEAHEERLRQHAEREAKRQQSQEKPPTSKAEPSAARNRLAAPPATPSHPQSPTAPAAPTAAASCPAKPRSGAAATSVVTVSVKKRRTLLLKPE